MAEKGDRVLKAKANRFFLAGILILLATVLVGGILGAAVTGNVRKKSQNRRKECVLRIGDKEVSREQFELFCITVIEGSSFSTLRAETASENALMSLIKTKACEYAQQYVALRTEAEKAGLSLSPLEKAMIEKKVDDIPKSANANDYYVKNYGVDRDGYEDFLIGWSLCEKYVNNAANVENCSEEELRAIFDANAEKLGWARADVIYFGISTADAGGAELKRSLAEDICRTVNGVPDADKERIFRSYYDNYSEEGFASSGINVELRGDIAASYPVLFDAVKNAEENHCYVVDDGIAVFAVRVRERFMFDEFRDTTEFLTIVRESLRQKAVDDALADSRYAISQTAAMGSVDIKPLVTARKKLDGR